MKSYKWLDDIHEVMILSWIWARKFEIQTFWWTSLKTGESNFNVWYNTDNQFFLQASTFFF